jgi:YVTN family beta-propeller protein
MILMLVSMAGAAPFAYIPKLITDDVSVIDTINNTVTNTIHVGSMPWGVTVTPDGSKVYVTNLGSNTVSVINTATNEVTAIGSGKNPYGIAVTPDGTKVYVANKADIPGDVSVIDIATNQVTTVPVGGLPVAFGQFISYGPTIPKITWNNPDDIVYGTALNNTQLNASATDQISGKIIQGNFVYTPPSGTVLGVGMQQTLSTNFIPTDTTKYTIVSANVSINVTQATPTITWSNPDDIVYGTALSGTQLDAIGSVPGPISYNPVAGTVLGVGTQTLNATLTPTDSTNYTTASATVSINVTKTNPTITWRKPVDVAYETALSNIQLDAAASDSISGASVPGFFFYTLPVRDALSIGQQMLNVLFLPTDLVDYNTTSATASINVLGMPSANFSINQTQGPVPFDVQFTDKTTGEPTSWYWDFGDGTNSNLQNPVHSYNTAGIYTPILTASNVVGSSTKTSTVPITVT